MSGLLRRIKRSRPADAGEPLPEGQAATSEEAAATPTADDPSTQRTAWMEPIEPERTPAETQPKPEEPPKPVLLANPDTPAGMDLEEQTRPRPPAGRRGRLRRRLRYLRRARELMLRDLGGLLFEVHRSGGADVNAHSTVLNTKIQRISGLDAEVHALETALASPRREDILFQPGIGGTCPTCGELFSSAAHFCANCGASVKDLPAPVPPPATVVTSTTVAGTGTAELSRPERRRFWQRVVGGRGRAAGAGDATAASEPVTRETAALEPAADQPVAADAAPGVGPRRDAAADESVARDAAADDAPGSEVAGTDAAAVDRAASEPARSEPAADVPAATDAAADEPAAREAPADDPAPHSNGRAGDTVATRRSPS